MEIVEHLQPLHRQKGERMMLESIPLLADPEGRALVRKHCDQAGITIEVLEQMVSAEIKVLGMGRRHGIFLDLEEVLGQIDDSIEEGKR